MLCITMKQMTTSKSKQSMLLETDTMEFIVVYIYSVITQSWTHLKSMTKNRKAHMGITWKLNLQCLMYYLQELLHREGNETCLSLQQ